MARMKIRYSKWYGNIKRVLALLFMKNQKAVEIHSGLMIALYAVLFCIGAFLFVQWNYVPTRELAFRMEELKKDGGYACDSVFGDDGEYEYAIYDLPAVKVSMSIPMTMQKDRGDGAGTIIYDFSTKKGDTRVDTTFSKMRFANRTKENYRMHRTTFCDSVLKEVEKTILIRDEFKANVYYMSLVRKTREYLYGKESDGDPKLKDEAEIGLGMYMTSRGGAAERATEMFVGCKKNDFDHKFSSIGGILSAPGWFNLCDISQSYYKVSLITETLANIEFYIDFNGVTNFSVIYPEPDFKSMSKIGYRDAEKIEYIKMHGLEFHASFNEMQNKQAIRSFALTCVMSLIIGMLFKEIVILCYNAAKKRKDE